MKKSKTITIDRETYKLMPYASAMYYIKDKAYDEYDFLKILSLKNKEVKKKDVD